MTAYLEKAGYGAQAAAPVAKCMFMALQGVVALQPEAANGDPANEQREAIDNLVPGIAVATAAEGHEFSI